MGIPCDVIHSCVVSPRSTSGAATSNGKMVEPGRTTCSEQSAIFKGRNIFRLKKGMKIRLLDQVASDNPEGCGASSKGWEVPVQHLLEHGGPNWAMVNPRVARENVRSWVQEWSKKNKEQENSTGTNEEETDEDKVCREIFELWKARARKDVTPTAIVVKEKKAGEEIRRKATEGLKERREGDHKDDEKENKTTPVKRASNIAVLEYLRDSNSVKIQQMDLEEKKLKLQQDQLKVQQQQQQLQFELQQQQLQQQMETQKAMLALMGKLADKQQLSMTKEQNSNC